MEKSKSLFQKLKPGVPKRALLFIAGMVWTFAGLMLMYRGGLMIGSGQNYLIIKLSVAIIAGGLFYYFLFDKISFKHTDRIKNLPYERPCVFSFFNLRSYLLMIFMISMGVALRTTEIIPLKYLSFFYVTMGIPLFVSAIRFYYNGIYFRKESAE